MEKDMLQVNVYQGTRKIHQLNYLEAKVVAEKGIGTHNVIMIGKPPTPFFVSDIEFTDGEPSKFKVQ